MIVTPEARNDAGEPFGPEVSVADDASPIVRLAAFSGRSV